MDGQNSDPQNDRTVSFVVKIFLEDTGDDKHKVEFHGHITHVPSGDRSYFRSLSSILVFIMRHLRSMGIRFGWYKCLKYRVFR
jgi:hypothetical protein